MTSYADWVRELLRAHRADRRYGRRCSGCWACDVLPETIVSETDRQRCKDLSRGAALAVDGFDGHHVLPKQLLKREFPYGAYVYDDGTVDRVLGGHRRQVAPNAEEVNGARLIALERILWDPRNGVPLRRWHHDQWEARRLSVPRSMTPGGVEEIAEELGLGWWLDRTFGEAVVG